ncbi:MAG: hypothetical protein WCJ33_08620, partial [Pseudomonadota bacterium]
MVNIKLKRFSRSKEQLPEETQPEPQPDSPSYLQSEPQIKKQRGRPKKNKVEDIQASQQQTQEPAEPQPQILEPEPVNYDDLTNDNFLDDLNNVHYKEEIEEPKQKIKDVKPNKKESSFSLDSKKLLDKIKKGSTSPSSSFSLDSHPLLDKIKKGKPQINNDFDSSMFSANGSEILGRDKRILLTKIRQYKSLFPDTFKTFKIKANANVQELQTYLD